MISKHLMFKRLDDDLNNKRLDDDLGISELLVGRQHNSVQGHQFPVGEHRTHYLE